ncbi:MAG TPA: BON domain-containing protein [Pyrinomonadaceae bacterium]|nr:BON domain-containing protein [Pyrinomonadaceae bacterium]
MRLFALLTFVILLAVLQVPAADGQQLRTTAATKQLISSLETNTDRFSTSVDAALDRGRLDDSNLEDQFNALVDEFELAADRLKDRMDDDFTIASDVREVLRRGLQLDMFMKSHKLTPAAQTNWNHVKTNLEQLARAYSIAWVWVPSTDTAMNRASTRQVIDRLEEAANDFRDSFEGSLDRSRLDDTVYEDFMNKVVATFENTLDRLEDESDRSGNLNTDDLNIVLNNAKAIDDFLRKHNTSARAMRDWFRVRANLDDLAFLNHVTWNWSRPAAPIAARNSRSMPRQSNSQSAQGQRVSLNRRLAPSAGAIAREVRHELLSDLPYYSVFDWIEFEVLPDNTVVLRGQVTTPPDTKSRAEDVIEDISGVSRVINEIEVLPVSPNDERLRRALYREIYGFDSPLFRYGVGSRQAIHIIVDRGRATLKGVVDNEGDRNVAYARARSVPGLFAVNNELMVESQMPR